MSRGASVKDTWLLVDVELEEGFSYLLKRFGTKTQDALYAFGKEVRDSAEPPIDTGALETSGTVYTRGNYGDFERRRTEAQALRPNARFAGKLIPDKNTVHIHWLAHYATYIELGTMKKPARPFAIPALEKEKRSSLKDSFIKEYQDKLIFERTVIRVR